MILSCVEPVSYTHLSHKNEQAEQYLSLVKKTDNAFKQLTNYFSKVKEPTIIVMFGDHQPAVQSSFYDSLFGKNAEMCIRDSYEVLSETPYGSTFLWKEQRYETKLPGRHQVSNAVTALAASEYLFRKDYEKNNARKAIAKKLDEMNVKSAQQGGIIRTCWPGRLEVLKTEPLRCV